MRKLSAKSGRIDESGNFRLVMVLISSPLSTWLTRLLIVLTVSILFAVFSAHVSARSLFELFLESEGQAATRGFSDIEQFIDQLETAGLQELIPAYTETSAADAVLDTRGLTLSASYAANSTALRFQVPCAGTDLNGTYLSGKEPDFQ